MRYDLVVHGPHRPRGPVGRALLARDLRARQARDERRTARSRCTSARPSRIPERVRSTLANLRQVFAKVTPYFVHIPIYGSIWGFACASDVLDPRTHLPPSEVDANHLAARGVGDLQYYNGDMHRPCSPFPTTSASWCADSHAQVARRVTLVLVGLAALAGCYRADDRASATSTRRARIASPTGATSPRTARPPPSPRTRARGFCYGPDYVRPWYSGRLVDGRPSSTRSIGSSARGSSAPRRRRARRLRLVGARTPRAAERPMRRESARPARRLARQGRGAGLLLPQHGRRLLGRARLLPLHRGRDRHARGGDGRAARALRWKRSGAWSSKGDYARFAIPEPFHGCDRALVEGGRQVALRALRPLVGRHRRAQAARVQRRHAHGAARGERRAVVLAAGRASRRPTSSTRSTRS